MTEPFGGRYELRKEIGAGGMGRVFEAVDLETGRIVAAKVMIATGEMELQALLRFQQEGAVLATLKHPNIVTVYGTFLEERTCAIVMELLEGISVGDLLHRERTPLTQTKQIAVQALSALEYAHARGIVHRDIKPDNIMVLSDGRVKVTDFGIARVLQTVSPLSTATGITMGTPLYMSPEQIEGVKADGRSDVYSLGVVLYQMVTGQPPFEGDEPLTIAFKHVHKAPQPPRDLNQTLPATWDAVILKALAKSPSDRFQTAGAMREVVEPLATDPAAAAEVTEVIAVPTPADAGPDVAAPQGEEVRAVAGPLNQPIPAPAPRAPGRPATPAGTHTRRRWAALGGGAILVLALLLAAFTVLRPQKSTAGKLVRVAVVAPAGTSLPIFQIRNTAEERGRTVTPTGSMARLSLLPGRYVLTVPDGAAYLDPAALTVRTGGLQIIHLDALYGRLILLPAAGRVVAPGFDLVEPRTGKSRHGVDNGQADRGIYVLPGRYMVSPWPSEYASTLPVTIRAHHQSTLNLAHLYGQLTFVQLAGAPPSGFDLLDPQTHGSRTGVDPGHARQGVFVPVGRYEMNLYNSDIYPDMVAVTIAPGGKSRVDLNTILTAVRTPAVATDYSVTYTWREGRATQSLQARTKARTYYIRAGTYPLEIQANGSTREATLRAPWAS